MNIVMLYFDIYIGKLVQAIIAFEGYQIISTNDPDRALRALEASATPCILITDNFGVNPVIYGALTRLRANPALRGKVWVVGLTAITHIAQQFLDQGLLDEWLEMPFTSDALLDILDRGEQSLP